MKQFVKRIIEYFENCDIKRSVLVIVILSAISVILQSVAQSQMNFHPLLSVLLNPLILLANAMPIFLLICIIYCFTNRIWIGYGTSMLVLYILLFINYFKTYFRSETLTINDLTLADEAFNIVKGYELPVPLSVILSLIFTIIVFIFTYKNLKTKRETTKNRIILGIICIPIAVLSYFTLYNKTLTYDIIPSFANEFNDVNIAQHKGFIYTFLTHFNGNKYEEPEGYSINEVKRITENMPDTLSEKENSVNVIAIMSEAFFDINDCKNIKFITDMHPTPNFERLKNEGIYGKIFVPGFAGSTASTEFEFLTGINISNVDSSMPVVYKTHINEDCYSLVRYFKDNGYSTVSMHPGEEWFYNRKATYKRLCFDRSYFLPDYEYSSSDMVNYYLSDKVTADKLINDYKDYLNSGSKNGYFNFTITIQNHGPYKNTLPKIIRFKNTFNLTDEEYNTFLNYANGLYDADLLLGRVYDFINSIDTPTVIVFFGDHLPYLDAEGSCLFKAGLDLLSESEVAFKNKYLTPYLIVGNDAFKSTKTDKDSMSGKKPDISSNYLSIELLKYMEYPLTPYYKAIDGFLNEVPIISAGKGIGTKNQKYEAKILNDYKYLSYWALQEYR